MNSGGDGSGRPARFLPGRHAIEAYGNGGFRFGGMSHRGSILALPSGIRGLDAAFVGDIDRAALAPVLAERDEIDLLLVGTGPDLVPLPDALRQELRAAGIGVDMMPTGAAARTYNVLVVENRKVGAVLIAVA